MFDKLLNSLDTARGLSDVLSHELFNNRLSKTVNINMITVDVNTLVDSLTLYEKSSCPGPLLKV